MEEEPSVPTKKPKVGTHAASYVPNLPMPTHMQNCVLNVYPHGSAQNDGPVQQNVSYLYGGCVSSGLDYDVPYRQVHTLYIYSCSVHCLMLKPLTLPIGMAVIII